MNYARCLKNMWDVNIIPAAQFTAEREERKIIFVNCCRFCNRDLNELLKNSETKAGWRILHRCSTSEANSLSFSTLTFSVYPIVRKVEEIVPHSLPEYPQMMTLYKVPIFFKNLNHSPAWSQMESVIEFCLQNCVSMTPVYQRGRCSVCLQLNS